ncbi:MAG: sigma-54-dependent transcriptional regulator [Verrucomicrobiales bacterium]
MEPSETQLILIVDPEVDFLDWARGQLESTSTRVMITSNAEDGWALWLEHRPDLLLAEIHIAPFSGLELLKRVREKDPNAMVVLSSAFSTTQSVIESMKLGAFDYLRKESIPFSFKMVIDSALRAREETKKATAFKPQLTVEQHQDSIVGKSEAMQEVFKMVGRVAHSDSPVLITGESGSGKELVARAIHSYSHRSHRDFVAINCAAIPETLLESELFGHEKGAFTGAVSQRIGRFEQSNGGTLFLDEIGDLPLAVQGKLLRVLQESEFCRLGGNQNIKTDVRIVAATNKNLEQEVANKTFREDLFYRLNVVPIKLPPLRQRLDDIRLLAEYFLQKISAQKRLPKLKLSEEAVQVLERHAWPGNVRELENTLQRACVLATTDFLLPKDLPLSSAAVAEDGGESKTNERELAASENGSALEPTPSPIVVPVQDVQGLTPEKAIDYLLDVACADPDAELLPWVEQRFTLLAMRRTKGNQIRAAKLLGVSRATLRKRLERFQIDRATLDSKS